MTDAQVTYCPGSVVGYGSTPTLAPLDATNLAVTFTASPSDTTVPRALNTDPFAAGIASYVTEATVTSSSGGHSDASLYSDLSGIVAFVNRCIT